jgi:hypothetical protein
MRWFVSKGWHGWALVLGLVIAFDLAAVRWGGEAMTDAARRWFNHGIGRWLIVVGIVYLAIHLTVLPYRYDPLHRGYAWLEKRFGPTANYEQPPMEEYPPGLD